jgi:hypothetical protein
MSRAIHSGVVARRYRRTEMKPFALAVAAAGLALTANTADAQYITYGSYSYPSYTYPAYYTYPSYYGSSGVVVAGYSPVVSAPVYSGWNYYSPSAWAPAYGYSSGYSNRGFYGYGNYGYGRGWRR